MTELNMSEKELFRIFRSFDFLLQEDYEIKELAMPRVEHPSLTFDGLGRYNRNVHITGGVVHYPDEREGEYEVAIFRKHFWTDFVRTFEVGSANATYLKLRRDKGVINIQDYYKHFDSSLINGKQYPLEVQANFIKEHLMPVIKGEVWIDELIKSKK